MDLTQTLLELEERGWTALSDGHAVEYYRAHLAPEALMLLPGGLVLDHDQVLESMAAAPPWSWHRIEEPRALRLGEATAVLGYLVAAQREGADEYRALVSSAYTRVDGEWRLAFHQQTPLD